MTFTASYNKLIILLTLLIICTILFLMINDPYPNIPPDPRPKPAPTPKPHASIIGGCKGTQFGCCSDEVTPCSNKKCSQC